MRNLNRPTTPTLWQSGPLITKINGPDGHNIVPHSISPGFVLETYKYYLDATPNKITNRAHEKWDFDWLPIQEYQHLRKRNEEFIPSYICIEGNSATTWDQHRIQASGSTIPHNTATDNNHQNILTNHDWFVLMYLIQYRKDINSPTRKRKALNCTAQSTQMELHFSSNEWTRIRGWASFKALQQLETCMFYPEDIN